MPDGRRPGPGAGALLRDPDDYYLLALAAETGADAIVSGDLDLHDAVGLPVEILTPRDALTRLDE